MPTGANIVTNGGACVPNFDNYDPLYSIEFPTVANSWYLIQVINEDCTVSTRDYIGCISADPTPSNTRASGATLIDQCGTLFSGTNKGYAPSNVLPGNENLDGNAATTCPTCTSGDEVPYVINNDSWFHFCATIAGDWSVDFQDITSCVNGAGLQMSLFKGIPTNLAFVWSASSPTLPGAVQQTSAAFTVNAGQCVYLVVDGFAGDQCDYKYELHNLTTPCVLLPIELGDFFVVNIEGINKVVWTTFSEINSDYFTLERSNNGNDWRTISNIKAAGNSSGYKTYSVLDDEYKNDLNYYRLSEFDLNGEKSLSKIISIDNMDGLVFKVKTVNVLGQEVDDAAKGLVFEIYSNGRINKILR